MTMIGLSYTAYWLSLITWEAIIALTFSPLIVHSGMMLQNPIFLGNSFPIVFLVYFLSKLSMIGLASPLSINGDLLSSSLVSMGFFMFVIGFAALNGTLLWFLGMSFLWVISAMHLNKAITNLDPERRATNEANRHAIRENPGRVTVEVYWAEDDPFRNLVNNTDEDSNEEGPVPAIICDYVPPPSGRRGTPQQGPLRGIVLNM